MYQTVSGYRSAISKFHVGLDGAPAGISKNVKRVTKAIFLEAPPIPRYAEIWPASQLVKYLETLHPPDKLSIYQLGAKTLTLVSLHSLSRASTVAKWLLSTMQGAGIDTAKYKAHSSRSAASSDMVNKGFSLSQILQGADWFQTSKSFEQHVSLQ